MIRLNLVEVNAMPWIGTLMGLGAAIVCWVILPVAVYWHARRCPNTNDDSCGLPLLSVLVGAIGFGGMLWYISLPGPSKFLILVVLSFVSVVLIDAFRRKGSTDTALLQEKRAESSRPNNPTTVPDGSAP